jgi:hypothetical protein
VEQSRHRPDRCCTIRTTAPCLAAR